MAGDRITAAEAAHRLGITTRTLWRWVEAGKVEEAPRTGNYRMFWTEDVDALARRRAGVPTVADMRMADVYARLADAQTWEDVDALKADLAAAICAHAKDKGPLEKSYSAATSMAATHPDEDARGRWARTAREYGAWLGIKAEDVDKAIANKGRKGSYTTYESAMAEVAEAPTDPARAMAER